MNAVNTADFPRTPERDFLDLACLTYTSNDSPLRIRRAIKILEQTPAVSEASIYTACVLGNVQGVEQCLASNPEAALQPGGPQDWAPLLFVCYERVTRHRSDGDSLAVARLLLRAGADPNAHFMWDDTYRFTALTGAIGEGEEGVENQPPHQRAREIATLLLESGANPNDAQGLYNSMFSENDQWLALLLRYGLKPEDVINWKSPQKTRTLDFMLGHAVKSGFAQRVELLLTHGADPNSTNYYDGKTHWENAVLHGFPGIAELLTHAGGQPVSLSTEDQFRVACFSNDAETARALLRVHPASINNPALLKDAAAAGHLNTVQLLLELGADINASGQDGSTPLHQAAWRGRLEMVKLLLAHGAVAVRDRVHDATPIGWAAYNRQETVLKTLLSDCSDPLDMVRHGSLEQIDSILSQHESAVHERDAQGHALIHYVANDRPDAGQVVELLVKYGADINAQNHNGETKLALALKAEATNMVDVLRKTGAREDSN